MSSIPCIIHPFSSDIMGRSYLLWLGWVLFTFIQVQAWQACLEMVGVGLVKLLILIKLYNNPHHINKVNQNVKIPQVLTKLFICQIIKNFTVKTRTGHIILMRTTGLLFCIKSISSVILTLQRSVSK